MNFISSALFSIVNFVIASVIAIVIHEGAHVLTALALGVRVKRIGITWRGPFLVREQGPPLSSALIALMGPLMNLILSALFWSVAPTFAQINLVLGLSNLMPLQGLDGWNSWDALRRTTEMR